MWLIVAVLIFTRLQYAKWDTPTVTQTLTWDAFGYYMYLPAQFIYHDIGPLNWFSGILDKYHPTGNVYQIAALPNGNRVMKYPLGIALLYWPFFFLGHWAAGVFHFPQDGFSAPYQLAICLAAIFYAFLGLQALRRVLLQFYSDATTAITLICIGLATNYIQYAAVECGMTHVYLFTLYAWMLLLTIRWHQSPKMWTALGIGVVFGLTTVSRPTEAVMLFIPLLWNTQNQALRQEKFRLLFHTHQTHFFATILGAFMAIFPQMLYWKVVTGKWVYDVGSKFMFLNPHWQVLFGWEKGMFVYTPIMLFVGFSLFLMKGQPFKRAVLSYFLLNLWIVLAWADWRYGASYATRALVQSYPVLALPFGILISRLKETIFKWPAAVLGLFYLSVNLLQIYQYNATILHYNDNNKAYYRAIYLNPSPTPLDMSLLDTSERLGDTSACVRTHVCTLDTLIAIQSEHLPKTLLFDEKIPRFKGFKPEKGAWLRITAQIYVREDALNAWLNTALEQGERHKQTRIRLHNGITKPFDWNTIQYDFQIPPGWNEARVLVFAESKNSAEIQIRKLQIDRFDPE